MRLSACRSGKTTSVSFLSSSRTMFLPPRSACSASVERAFVTTSPIRLSTTSMSMAFTLQTMRSQRPPRRERRGLQTLRARLLLLPPEHIIVAQRPILHTKSHGSHGLLLQHSSAQDCRADYCHSPNTEAMTSYGAVRESEPRITGVFHSEHSRPRTDLIRGAWQPLQACTGSSRSTTCAHAPIFTLTT